jgi:hypothetical protein
MKKMPTFKNWAVFLSCCGALSVSAAHSSNAAEPGARAAESSRLGVRNGQSANLARANIGARLDVQAANAQAANAQADAATASAALLHDDDPLGYPLAEGSTSMILTLPKIEVLNRFNFLNLTASGKVAISVSNAKQATDGAGWRQVQAPKEFSGADVINCDLGSVEARYVKIDFQIEKSGRIDTFGLFGMSKLGAASGRFATLPTDSRAMLYNYAVASPQTGVVMVSPGENLDKAQSLADGDVGTSFTFKATDPMPMAVIDLGGTRTLNRTSVSFKSGPGHMDVYLLPDPQERPGFQRVSATASREPEGRTIQEVIANDFPAGRTPIISEDTGKQTGLNRLSANANGQTGRYLVMVFHPAGGGAVADNGQPAGDFKDFKDFKDTRDYKDSGIPSSVGNVNNPPLEVSELRAFGNNPPNGVDAENSFPGVPGFPGGNQGGPGGGTVVVPPTTPPNAPPVFPPSQGGGIVTP